MFVLITFCLFKIVMWIVYKNLSPMSAEDVTHFWFQLNTGLSVSESSIYRYTDQVIHISLPHR